MATQTTLSSFATIATALSTEFNSLANGSSTAASSAIDNSSALDMWADMELNLGTFGVAPSAGAYVEVYLIPSVDGTNYADGAAATAPAQELLVGAFSVRAATAAQRLVLRGVPIPPGLFKLLCINRTGQAMNASGNTLKYRTYHLTNT